MSEFFEQFHVLVTPVFASKYPPGNALALAPGAWLGWPALGPIALAGISAGLLIALARNISDGRTAVLTLLLWFSSQRTLIVKASYFSENTSGTLWLLGWWGLLKWRSGDQRGLTLTGCAVSLMALTRPLTAVAYSIPVIAAVGWTTYRRGTKGGVAPALVAMVSIVLAGALYNRAVTGDATRNPWQLYAAYYSPFEQLGFGFNPTPPLRDLPSDMTEYNASFERTYTEHTVANLPKIAVWRALGVVYEFAGGSRILLLPLIIIGLTQASLEAMFSIATGVSLLTCYLLYAHGQAPPYYAETQPALGFLAASGAMTVGHWILNLAERVGLSGTRRLSQIAFHFCCLLVGAHLLVNAAVVRGWKRQWMSAQRSFFQRALDRGDEQRIVFVRYRTGHNVHQPLIQNEPDIATAPVWYVRDRGPDNSRLMAMHPGRKGYLFIEDENVFRPYGLNVTQGLR